ncbi:serine hydrolase, partial [Sphingomonas sp. NPDC019816]|uniref:serine hydrolase n=1 Tax=Sphingomonas sp. NPDC019816 TaxID=3390679 RepID=UPI003CFF1DF0
MAVTKRVSGGGLRIWPVGFLVILSACGTDSRPGASAHAPSVPEPSAAISMPLPPPRPMHSPAAPAELVSTINSLSAGFSGKKGIAVRAVDDGWTVEVGGRQRLPQQSVSKLWVAITLLSLRDQGRARLDEPIVVRHEDLTLFHQPIAMLVKGDGYHTTVGELLTRALTQSDNTANDRLLTYVGGPQAVRTMIANKRLGDIRFGPGERLLQAKTAGLTWQPAFAA